MAAGDATVERREIERDQGDELQGLGCDGRMEILGVHTCGFGQVAESFLTSVGVTPCLPASSELAAAKI